MEESKLLDLAQAMKGMHSLSLKVLISTAEALDPWHIV